MKKTSLQLNFNNMSNSELNYIDTTDAFTKNMYVRTAPQPQAGTSVQPIEVPNVLPPIERRNSRNNQNETVNPIEQREKRVYTKVTNQQKELFTNLFYQHNDDWTSEQYAHTVGIKLKQAEKFLTLLRNGKPLHKDKHYQKKSRTIPYQQLVKKTIERDPSTSLQGMREIIIRKKMLEEEVDNPENTSIQTIDQVNEMSVDEIIENTKGMNLLPPKENWNVPSESSIRRYLKGEIKNDDLREIPKFTFKRETTRAAVANTEENKTARQNAVKQLREYIRGGAKWVCIDESSWRVASTPCYGWSKRGEKCFITKAKGGIRLTSLTAVECDGFALCDIVSGQVTKEIYESYFKRLIKHYDDLNVKCVFWADNCSIHNSMRSIVQGSNHVVVFNSAYSPEINPIENIFGIWKRSCERDIREWRGTNVLLEQMKIAFQNISTETFISSFEKVRNEIWYKVEHREDL